MYRYIPSQKGDSESILNTYWWEKIFKKSTILKVLRTFILHMNNLKKLLTNYRRKKIDLSICPNTYEFVQIFFWFLEIPNIEKSLSRICESGRSSDFWFKKKKKSKIGKKSEKIRVSSDKLLNQSWRKKITLPVFFVEQLFFLLIC